MEMSMSVFNINEITTLNRAITVWSMDFKKEYITTIEDFVEHLKKYKKYSLMSRYQWKVNIYLDNIMKTSDTISLVIEYDAGTYSISSDYINTNLNDEYPWQLIQTENYYKEPVISSAMFYNFINGKMYDVILRTDVVSTYKEIIWGKRAPKGFWKNMTDEEFYAILSYEANFLFDISSMDKARHFVTNDTYMSRVPATIKAEKGIRLYDIVRKAQPISSWEMRSLPQRMSFSDKEMFNAIVDCLTCEGIEIQALKRRHIIKHAPCLMNKFHSTRNIREFYLGAVMYGIEGNATFINTEGSVDNRLIDQLNKLEIGNSDELSKKIDHTVAIKKSYTNTIKIE